MASATRVSASAISWATSSGSNSANVVLRLRTPRWTCHQTSSGSGISAPIRPVRRMSGVRSSKSNVKRISSRPACGALRRLIPVFTCRARVERRRRFRYPWRCNSGAMTVTTNASNATFVSGSGATDTLKIKPAGGSSGRSPHGETGTHEGGPIRRRRCSVLDVPEPELFVIRDPGGLCERAAKASRPAKPSIRDVPIPVEHIRHHACVDDIVGCFVCDLSHGRVHLPGGSIHRTDHWVVEHCAGPLGVGTLIVKPSTAPRTRVGPHTVGSNGNGTATAPRFVGGDGACSTRAGLRVLVVARAGPHSFRHSTGRFDGDGGVRCPRTEVASGNVRGRGGSG